MQLPRQARPVLAGVTLTVGAGETVSLVGESGSGKSLTARSAIGLTPAGAQTTGSIAVAGQQVLTASPGRLRTLRSRTASMVFQDPRAAVNPLHRIGDFLIEAARYAQPAYSSDPLARARELCEAVHLPERTLRQHPHELSGGMLQRVAIAAALMPDPQLLVADEPTTALDATTQAETIALLADLRDRFHTGLLFITHDLDLAAAISDRICVMYAGRIIETGTPDQLFTRPQHPYTAALLQATPRLHRKAGQLTPVPGSPPDLHTRLTGCAFAPRCPHRTDICLRRTPPADPVACHHTAELDLHV
ncbi:ABC transporter ATP-binding protein [Streptomyces sp. NBC_00859]|uniref:ABC transporter ATP-binding protein n=1 Tax=Streptomyces sp. NBC_00859 TaxID=2903682 RepID=UPI0038672FDE|nr:ABC transporter ATP-binding protein [Streptomyces sp. NBC_00859]